MGSSGIFLSKVQLKRNWQHQNNGSSSSYVLCHFCRCFCSERENKKREKEKKPLPGSSVLMATWWPRGMKPSAAAADAAAAFACFVLTLLIFVCILYSYDIRIENVKIKPCTAHIFHSHPQWLAASHSLSNILLTQLSRTWITFCLLQLRSAIVFKIVPINLALIATRSIYCRGQL